MFFLLVASVLAANGIFSLVFIRYLRRQLNASQGMLREIIACQNKTITETSEQFHSINIQLESVHDQLALLKQGIIETHETNRRRILQELTGSSSSEKIHSLKVGTNTKSGLVSLASIESPRINLGCGSTYHRDWVNLDLNPISPDVIGMNLIEPLPFDSNSIEVAYSSHVLEHLPPHKTALFVKEVFRVLKPSGIFRIVVPDLEMICREYLTALSNARSGDKIASLQREWMVIEMVDQLARETPDGGEMLRFLLRNGGEGFNIAIERLGGELLATPVWWDPTKSKAQWIEEIRDLDEFSDSALFERRDSTTAIERGNFRLSGEPHQWMYDDFSLFRLLQDCGFASISRKSASESDIPGFNTYRLDISGEGLARKPDSLYMEAIKA